MTTGAQVKNFLYTLYPEITPREWDETWRFSFNRKLKLLSIRVSTIGTVDKLIEALKANKINPMSVDIDVRWEHLQITFCDFDFDSDFDFSTDY